MRKAGVWIALICCFIALTAMAQGQARKAGLWEVTTQMSMGGASAPQMPQMPAGMQMPPGMKMPASPYAPHTSQVCVTQAMVDKYGGPYSAPPHGDCKMTDIVMKPTGMTAKMVCTGALSATGAVETTFVDAGTSKTSVHIVGTMQMNQGSHPIDMTMTSMSSYKGSDCGSVQPMTVPAGN